MSIIEQIKEFFSSLKEYCLFLSRYFRLRLYQSFRRFEEIKDIIVNWLVVKRGKYSRSFLHTSISGLFLIGITIAPLIKEVLTEGGEEEILTHNVLAETNLTLEESTATEISVKPRDSIVTYSVAEGDTIASIAKKFGVSEETILWQNNLEKTSIIKPGQKLEIPPITGIVHKVKRGETVYSLAKKYSVDPQNIVNWPFNTFANDETFELAVGQLLVIPDGIKPKEEPPKEYLARVKITPSAGSVSATGQFIWPASGTLTQYYQWYHKGIDIANPAGPDILAADSGKVISAISQRYAYGNHILIDHGNGFITLYAHLSSFYVSQGQTVNRGDAIGKMGCTGRCTGTHLHFEIRYNGSAQNPLNYLK
ncbi:MAG: M23 family metallopeptidase [candidate division WOR-3 bacterium]